MAPSTQSYPSPERLNPSRFMVYDYRKKLVDYRKLRRIMWYMAIEVRLDLMLARRKMRLTELSDRVGIAMTNLSLLKTGKVKAIRFSTLEALCRELGCQPGDLLEFVPIQAGDRPRWGSDTAGANEEG